MELKKNFQSFDVQSVALRGRNLIEASAGTGKTYSIAVLVLRLVLEEKMNINKILMVTFTKAAVAELEERIRLFVRNAYKIANGDLSVQDPTLKAMVSSAIRRDGKEEIVQLLNEAKLLLDETAVMTIHSFCQVTLNEFALETKQLFGSEMLQDVSLIRQEQVDIFWREQVAVLHPDLLRNLADIHFSRKSISKIIDRALSGQHFLFDNAESNPEFSLETELDFLEEIKLLDQKLQENWEHMLNEFSIQKEDVIKKCEGNAYARKSLLPLIDDARQFFEKLDELKEKGYAAKLFGEWIEKLLIINNIMSEKKSLAEEIANRLYSIAIRQVVENIQQYKDDNGLLSFDDLIYRLHNAISSGENSKLIAKLREKYQAVFIDEFQDTDQFQYQIFDHAFGKETIVFYIGDPKQSIYAWRQADINTYFKAGKEVDNRYGMNINYRSSLALITSMNIFFQPTEEFDTFNFHQQEDEITYIPVEASATKKEFKFVYKQEEQPGITVFTSSKKDEIIESVANQVLLLLTDQGNMLEKNGQRSIIRPSDIGILVRSNEQGQDVKKQLSKLGIPSVTIDTNKVLMTSEAKYVYYLLKAIFDINRNTISRALLSPFTGFSTEDLLQLEFDRILIEFGVLKQIWETSGIYAALTRFIDDFGVRENLLDRNKRRTLTNLLQIIEILHKTQSLKSLSALELMNWLKMAEEGLRVEGDEYEQRIESDQDAVEIVTIHKSKGLEYNIVLAPFLDLKADFEKYSDRNRTPLASFRSEKDGKYLFAPPDKLNQQQKDEVLLQIEQENKRLIYVAITRAVFKCYIFKNNSNYSKNSSLSPFIDAILSQPETSVKPYIDFAEQPTVDAGYRYQVVNNHHSDRQSAILAHNFKLRQKSWVKMSYTYLARKPEYIIRENNAADLVDYNHFIFKHLIRGSLAGNFLHHIFENIDFMNEQTWEPQIRASLSHYLPKQTDILPMIKELVHHVLSSSLKLGNHAFKLTEVSKEQRLNELEFNFNVAPFQGRQLNQLSTEDTPFVVRTLDELEGIMNGKIDMVFQHKQRYYILDWKSNFLGDSLVHYEGERLHEVLTENNYHLQYLIYVLALKKYLKQRLPDFDYDRDFGGVIYTFIRGARANNDTGIYTAKPTIEQISKLEDLLS